jgi:hypothetical protein
MQQTFPKTHELLGRPRNKEQMLPGTQIPSSPVGDLQASKVVSGSPMFGFKVMAAGNLLARFWKGLHVLAGVKRLLKMPVLIKLAPKPPSRKRFSTWLCSTSLPKLELILTF